LFWNCGVVGEVGDSEGECELSGRLGIGGRRLRSGEGGLSGVGVGGKGALGGGRGGGRRLVDALNNHRCDQLVIAVR
jgi:hypothetical protein